jgi:hypothetical protein
LAIENSANQEAGNSLSLALSRCFPEVGALFMADSIRMDLRDLGVEAWVLWQPDWEVIRFDPNGGAPSLKKQYY